jgi:hypothetical protein
MGYDSTRYEYKGYHISASVYNRPDGEPFYARVSIEKDFGSHVDQKFFDDPDTKYKTKKEAEEASFKIGKHRIDSETVGF